MNDPINPTLLEIRAWAFAAEAVSPEQDWDVIISGSPELHQLFVELADNDACPKAHFFLRLLYLIVGDAVRTKFNALPQSQVAALLSCASQNCTSPELKLWIARSHALVADPTKFRYEAWCEGGLASPQRS
jgi:hypothetical protein